MPSLDYKTPGFPLELERAERFVVDVDDELIIEPEEQKPKPPVKGEKEA